MYAVSTAVSAFFFATWKRLDDDSKSRVWRRYGWFSALTFVGSVGGLVTAAADIQYRYNFYKFAKFFEDGDPCDILLPDILAALDCYQPRAFLLANVNYWLAVNPVPYAIEFLCLCCAKLLVRVHSRLRFQAAAPFCNHGLIVIRLLSGWWSLSSRGSSFEAVGSTFYPASLLFASPF
jgi:hypothetical protein